MLTMSGAASRWARENNSSPRTSRHALERLTERLGLILSEFAIANLVANSDLVAADAGTRSIAYVAWRLGGQSGVPWGERSNGDVVVAIIRDRRVVTYMLRRSTQPHEPAAYDVDEVL